MSTTRYESKIITEYKNLREREKIIKEIISLISVENYLSWSPQKSSSYKIKYDLKNGIGQQLRTQVDDFKVEYFELWKSTGKGKGDNELWNLDKAYFALLKKNYESEDFIEFLALHCEAGFLPERTLAITKEDDDIGYLKQKKQEKYQRMIHLHNVFLKYYAKEKDCPYHSFLSDYNQLSKSHLAITLGNNKSEFDSIDSMTIAMKEAIKMIKDEILDVLV